MATVEDLDPAELLRAHGLRVTPQRRAIVEVVAAAEVGHLTADEIHARAREQLPELSRATVYNVLGEFVRAGLLRTVEGLGALRYDRNLDTEHHHFRCVECEQLFDVHLDASSTNLALEESGFQVRTSKVMLEGTCPACAAAAA